jgi:hypothetical protein
MMDADDCSKNMADYSIKKDEILIPTSSSSNGENSLEMEELTLILNIENESALDGEVGKRITEMVPVSVSMTSAKLYHIAMKIKIIFLPNLSD